MGWGVCVPGGRGDGKQVLAGELSLFGKRELAGELFLFGVKKEPKNRHRFEAVDADQGCGPGPGECGHLTTAYSPGWGPVNKEWI